VPNDYDARMTRINRLPVLLLSWSCALLLLVSLASAGEAPRVSVRPEAPALPEKALAAAAGRWKLERAAERAGTPGPAGQHDLFWEIVHLWEKDETARAEADLLTVAEWLLFSAGLVRDPRLADPVYRKLPGLAPGLGVKVFEKRLEPWLAGMGNPSARGEPWSWPEFPEVDRKVLAEAVRNTAQHGPRNNPVVRFWLAAALVACGAEDGEKELTAAWEALGRDVPSQSKQIGSAAATSLAGAGIKLGLRLLLDQAEAELAETERLGTAGRLAVPPSLNQVYALLGWSLDRFGTLPEHRSRLAAIRKALEKGMDSLGWDAATRRFTGLVPPGLERLAAAAQALTGRYDLKPGGALAGSREEGRALFRHSVELMARDGQAARDQSVVELCRAVLEVAEPEGDPRLRELMLVKLPGVNRQLGVECWARFISAKLAGAVAPGPGCGAFPSDLLDLGQRLPELDRQPAREACSLLLPEMKRACDAGNGRGAGERLARALACVFVGGNPEEVRLQELLAELGRDPELRRSRSQLALWGQGMAEFGNAAGLRLMLDEARQNPGLRVHTVACFSYLAGLSDTRTPPGRYLPDEIQLRNVESCAKWLEANREKLIWNSRTGRFAAAAGVAPPQLETEPPRARVETPAPRPAPEPPDVF
jgi:hypothetical protein